MEQVLLFNSGVPRAEGGAFLGVYFAREANAMIIKLNTFNPDGGAYGPLLGGAASGNPKGVSGKPFLAALHNAFETAAQFAKPRGITKMMLDVSGAVGRRGGKSADLAAFFLLRLLHTEWRGPGELCDAAAIRVTAFTELFAKGAAAAAQRLAGALAGVSGEDLKQAGLSLAQASLSASQMMVALGGAKLEESAETLRASASLLQVAVEAGQLTDGTLRELVNRFVLDRLQPAAEAAIREALGISASNIELLSGGKPQGLTWLDQGRWYAQHGGRNVSYTQRFFPSTCLAALEEFSVTGQRSFATAFTQVVLLVDGACGDGCSTLTSRLALSSSVRTVSHGGLVSLDAIDISPLGGGSGEGFQDVALSYLMLLLMGEEAMPSLDRLPRPLPTRAEVHLSVDTIFDPYLGTRALPREFYSLHADVHLPLWAESSGKLPRSSDAGSEGILPLWKIALLELASAPMLGDWLQAERDVDGSPPPPSTLPSISTEVLPHGGRQPILDVVLRDTLLLPTMQVTVISALIIFRDMIMSDVTDALRNTLRNRIAAGAGITVDHVVVISVMPGSVVWNISAVFPSTGLELVLDYKEALETNVPSLFSKDHVLHRFNPEKTVSPACPLSFCCHR